jgi:hypothetical protein
MRAVDIHVVGARSGQSPTLTRAAARGVLAVVFFLSTFTAYTFVLGNYDTPLSSFHHVTRAVSIARHVHRALRAPLAAPGSRRALALGPARRSLR